MFATGETVGLAEWIIGDTYLVLPLFIQKLKFLSIMFLYSSLRDVHFFLALAKFKYASKTTDNHVVKKEIFCLIGSFVAIQNRCHQ